MATKTINSDKSETKVGTSGTKLFTSTRTTYSVDTNGKIDPKSVKHEIIYYDAPLSPGIVAATSTGTSNDWKFEKNIVGQPILGADAQKSLKEGALKSTTQQQIQTAATKEKITQEQQKALSTKQVNTATNQTEVDEAKLTEALSKELEGTRNKFPGANGKDPLVYPITLRSSNQDVIKFRMVQYSPKKFDRSQTDKDLSPFQDRRKIDDKNTIGTVVLPIPSGINDINTVTWGSDSLDPLTSNLVNIANAAITNGFGMGSDVAGGAAQNVAANASDVKQGVANAFVQAATGTTNLLSRTKGAIYNPNMELLFQAPTLRPFTFNFKLSARSSKEAETIRSIIRFFKQGMSPIRTQSQLFLKAPHTFQIEYLHRYEKHNFLNKFKECALQSFSVDYTPEGQYATFTDGAMVSYQISMQFQELEPIFNDDYGNANNNPDTEIGY